MSGKGGRLSPGSAGSVNLLKKSFKLAVYWCFHVGQDEVSQDQVPDLPYLSVTTWASHNSLHNPTAPNPPSTMTCPAKLN